MNWWDKCKVTLRRWASRLALTSQEDSEDIEMLTFNKSGSSVPVWRRTQGSSLTPTNEQWSILTVLAIQTVIIIVFYQFRLTRMILYPFAIISTVFHEFGHALMCVLTGGRVRHIVISMDESGLTRFSGGWSCFILPAGYIGSTLIGAIMLFMAFGHRSSNWTALGVLGILLITLWYSDGLFTVISSLTLMALVGWAWYYRDGTYTRHFILFLGAIASFQGILSILNTTVFHTIEGSDAYVFARKCSFLIPAFVYGLLWFIISLALVGASLASALVFFKRK